LVAQRSGADDGQSALQLFVHPDDARAIGLADGSEAPRSFTHRGSAVLAGDDYGRGDARPSSVCRMATVIIGVAFVFRSRRTTPA
jgi:hypothetical protein